MNKSDLITRIAENADLSIAQATEVVQTFLYTISDELKEGKKISISGFGTFTPHDRKPRTIQHPTNGSTLEVPAKRVVRFRAGKELKEWINEEL